MQLSFPTDKLRIAKERIDDVKYLPATVSQSMNKLVQIPVLVFLFLENLDPHVGDCHPEAVVKSNSAFLNGTAQGRHTTHIFRHSDCVGIQCVNEIVGLENETETIIIGA